MIQRGRKTTKALAAIEQDAKIVAIESRLEPPPDLEGDALTEWQDVVNRCPPHWFKREHAGLLTQYCRHIVSAKKVSQLLKEYENPSEKNSVWLIGVKDYDRLLRMQEKETKMIILLATKMRISQQSTISHEARKDGIGMNVEKPWE